MAGFEVTLVEQALSIVSSSSALTRVAETLTAITWPLVAVWLILLVRWSRWRGVLAFLAALDTALLVWVIKIIVQRPRPPVAALTPLVSPFDPFSLPSGHAAVLMVLALMSFQIDRRVGSIGLLLAFLVGVSRVAVGVHYPSDVLIGWCIGILVVCLWGWFAARIKKRLLSIAKRS